MKTKSKELKAPENPLWLKGDGYTVMVSKEAEKLKTSLLTQSKAFTRIDDSDSAGLTKGMRDDINKMLIDVEKVRKLVKEPVIAKGREIDQIAQNFTMELGAEKARLDTLLGAYTIQQEAIRREAQERAMKEAAEAARLQREQEEAEARAERLRLGAEQAAAEAESRKEQAAARAAQEAAAAEQRRADDLARQAGASGMAAHHASIQVMDAARTKGTSVVLDYTVEDIERLHQVMPHLVELTPRRRDILSFLNQQKESGVPVGLPGLKVVEVARVR